MSNQEKINKDGWILIKNVFTKEEINKFREYVKKNKEHKGDLLSADLLKGILIDERILSIFKESLGSDNLYYFGDSSVSYNSVGNGFHKDSRDRKNKNSSEFTDENYSLLRLGIYLQDHSKHSKGLCLRSKSHLFPTTEKGKIINVKSEIGDVVIWKLTTTHSANADIISLIPGISFHPRIARRFPSFMKQKAIDPRIALFMTFGVKDDYSFSYISYLKTRQYAIDRWIKTKYNDELIRELKNKNVEVYNDFDTTKIIESEVSVEHKQP
jgi:ectoine hydroxylase-related dioxygenase (phytanoyl-CoA dioxygenase family)